MIAIGTIEQWPESRIAVDFSQGGNLGECLATLHRVGRDKRYLLFDPGTFEPSSCFSPFRFRLPRQCLYPGSFRRLYPRKLLLLTQLLGSCPLKLFALETGSIFAALHLSTVLFSKDFYLPNGKLIVPIGTVNLFLGEQVVAAMQRQVDIAELHRKKSRRFATPETDELLIGISLEAWRWCGATGTDKCQQYCIPE